METALLITLAFTMMYCMVAKRLATTIVTAPMIFLAFGVLLSFTDLVPHNRAEALLHIVAEVALVILLFLDASQTNLSKLRVHHVWPMRMLLIGLPLAMAIGTLAAWPFLPGWPIMAVALAAAILSPTDAALGQAVVTNQAVPERERRCLTVESGLNDGLALPLILLFACLTAGLTGGGAESELNWPVYAAMQITLGPLAGVLVGFVGGKVLIWALNRHTTAAVFEGVAALALAGTAYLFAVEIGGNGFIAAFTAGLVFGNIVKGRCKFIYEFTESEGQLLTWSAFLLVGLALVPEAVAHLTPSVLAIILISLFVVRPLAIWLSLIGTDARPLTRLFFGWFGPRGLATALFALLVISEIDHEFAEPILHLAINTVWISALLHGISAVPAATRYGARRAETPSAPSNPV